MPPWKKVEGNVWSFSVEFFSGTRIDHELCIHCFSRYSAMLLGLAAGGVVLKN